MEVASPTAVEARLNDWLGPFEIVADHSWPHGESRVWEIESAGGRAFAKAMRLQDHFARETAAYHGPVAALGDHAPRLLFEDEALRLILISRIDGIPAQQRDPFDPDTYRQAGALLARFHSASPTRLDAQAASLPAAELQQWEKRARPGLIAPADLAAARTIAASAAELGPLPLVPCHRDFSPRNWLVDDDGIVRLIDFQAAREDYWTADFVRMLDEQWLDRPALRDAFFEGYGKSPDEVDQTYLRAYSARWVVSTIVWSDERGDADFEAFGRRMLARLLKEG